MAILTASLAVSVLMVSAQIRGGEWERLETVEASGTSTAFGERFFSEAIVDGSSVVGVWRDDSGAPTSQRNVIGRVRIDPPGVLWDFRPVAPLQSSIAIVSVPDVSGDGIEDVLVGVRTVDRAWLLDGESGQVVFEFEGAPGSEFGFSVSSINDINQDGIGDFAISADRDSTAYPTSPGAVHLFSGVDGAFVRSLFSSSSGHVGGDLANAGDWDGDGYGDLAYLSSDNALVFDSGLRVISGRTGDWLHVWDNSDGDVIAALPDVSGDGLPDFVLGTPSKTSSTGKPAAGLVQLFHSSMTTETWSVEGLNGNETLGTSFAVLPDLDFDGFVELAVGCPNANVQGNADAGRVRILSSRDGAILRNIKQSETGARFGRSIAVGKLSGRPVLAIGSPEFLPSGGPVPTGKIDWFSFNPQLATSRDDPPTSGTVEISFEIDFPATESGDICALFASKSIGEFTVRGVSVSLSASALFWQGFSGYPFLDPVSNVLDAKGNCKFQLKLPSSVATALGEVFVVALHMDPSLAVGMGEVSYPVELDLD